MGKIMQICPCCGQKIVEYKHNFNTILFRDLNYLVKAGGSASLHDIANRYQMTPSEYANFQKLQYFGLVVKDGTRYTLTDRAKAFLAGVGGCPDYVITRTNKVIKEGPEIEIGDVLQEVQDKEVQI